MGRRAKQDHSILVHDFVVINDLRAHPYLVEVANTLKLKTAYEADRGDAVYRIVHVVEHFGMGVVEFTPGGRMEHPPVVLDLQYVALYHRPEVLEGDRVVLLETPIIDDEHAPGWRGGKRFLVAEARAEVRRINERGAWLAFDDDTDPKGLYAFSWDMFRKE